MELLATIFLSLVQALGLVNDAALCIHLIRTYSYESYPYSHHL